MLRLTTATLVTLLVMPMLSPCLAALDTMPAAAHECCRKQAPPPEALKLRPCCVAPDPALPARSAASPTPTRVVAALPAGEMDPAVLPAATFVMRDVNVTRSARAPAYLRHCAMLI